MGKTCNNCIIQNLILLLHYMAVYNIVEIATFLYRPQPFKFNQMNTHLCANGFLSFCSSTSLESVDIILQTRWNIATLKEGRESLNEILTASKKIVHVAEALVQHQSLAVILLIFGTRRIRRTIGMRYEHSLLASACWL